MRTSNQVTNGRKSSKPTVMFYFVVQGEKVKGKMRTSRVLVLTSKKDADTVFKKMALEGTSSFAAYYEAFATTSKGLPDLKASKSPKKIRWGIDMDSSLFTF